MIILNNIYFIVIMKELSPEMINLIENINKCCIEIIKKNNSKIKLKKIDSLEKKGFYDEYSNELFDS
jgi:ribosomal protein S8